MDEVSFYKNGSVSVTQSRFIVGDKTYAMRNISSVQIGIITPSRTLGILFVIIGVLLAFNEAARVVGLIIAVIAGVYAYSLKDKYSVRISTNSGETDGLISEKRQYIQEIVNALNEAMVHRG